jgi:hypothetical protein
MANVLVRIMSLVLLTPLALSPSAIAQNPPPQQRPSTAWLKAVPDDSKNFASLEDVTNAVTAALNQVKLNTMAPGSPTLKSAEFDFQTVNTTTAGGGIRILALITAGGTRERDATSETAFTYTLPTGLAKPNSLGAGGWWDKIKQWFGKNKDYNNVKIGDELPKAIQAAAMSMQHVPLLNNPDGPNLTHRSFTVSICFKVLDTFNGSADFSSLIVVSPTLSYSHSKSYTQTIKLTFEDPTSHS